MKKVINKTVCTLLIAFVYLSTHAQNSTAKASIVLWDGMVVGGYVNNGCYVNFGGPSLKLNKKPFSFGFGILPTMRIKEDKVAKGAMKNSIVTPTAGFGFTVVYKHVAVQVPFYYNPKTATANGRWYPGIGIGYKL
jgi:hypothetical protein